MIIGLASECLSRPGVWFQASLWAYLIAKPFQPVIWSECCLRFMRKLRCISFLRECAGRRAAALVARLVLLCLEHLANDQGVQGCFSSAFLILEEKHTLTKDWWNTGTDRHVWRMSSSSVKSHLFCLQKVLQAGQLIHMLTSYTRPAAPSRASQFLCFQQPTKHCPAFHPKLYRRVTYHMLPYTADIEHKCFGPQSQMHIQVKRTQSPQGVVFLFPRGWYILPDGPLGASGESSFSIWW